MEAGRSLQEIRDSRLYREQYQTFEAYCHSRWGFTPRRAEQLIDAYESFKKLEAFANNCSHPGKHQLSQMPTSEGQMRALSAAPPELRAAVWERTVEATDGKPTAAAVTVAVQALKAMVGDEVLITAKTHPHRQQTATIIDDTDGVFVAETDQGTTGILTGQFEIIAKAEQPAAKPSRPSLSSSLRSTPISAPTRALSDWSRAELINRLEEIEVLLGDILSSATTPQRYREKIKALLNR